MGRPCAIQLASCTKLTISHNYNGDNLYIIYPASFRGRIIQDLPKLRQLDGETVTKIDRKEVGYVVSSSEEEEEEEDEEVDEDIKETAESTVESKNGYFIPLLQKNDNFCSKC